MRRILLVLVVACADEKGGEPTCESLQLSKQEIGECIVPANPEYADGCQFALGGYCYPSGRPGDCDPQFEEFVCNIDNTNCHYVFPYCEPVDATRVRYGVRMVRDGVRGVVVLDDQSTIEADHCTFIPCQ